MAEMEPDIAVVQRIIQGDVQAFAIIVDRYEVKLRRYVRALVYDHTDHDDILQEIFLKTFRNLQSFQLSRTFSSWIYRVAHNEAINYSKKQKRHSALPVDDDSPLYREDSDYLENALRDDGISHIRECFTDLDQKYLEVLYLRYRDEKSYEEISDILRIPIATVGTLIRRGTQQLREICKTHGYDS